MDWTWYLTFTDLNKFLLLRHMRTMFFYVFNELEPESELTKRFGTAAMS